ncbi:hypothetical protein BASA81_012416 [Batrachochytrium salamandrivorans]|nr:hypothetical protein BASA81_012416 [Batrachochytrium salamandrivorans]
MGVAFPKPAKSNQGGAKDEVAVSQSIDRTMRMAREEEQSQIKLLLLGSENSGKSTVMKQFQIIHKMGFSAEERKVFRDQLWKSAIESMRALVNMREDYISTHNLSSGEEEFGVNLSLLDPYVQFLQARVQSDMELFEELDIPVAARTMNSPRVSSDFSPLAVDQLLVNNNPTLTPVMEMAPLQITPVLPARKRTRRKFTSLEEEVLHRRAKYQARAHSKQQEFTSLERELDFYLARIARKRELLARAKKTSVPFAAAATTTTTTATATPPPLSKTSSFTDSLGPPTPTAALTAATPTMATTTATSSLQNKIHQVKWEKLTLGRLLQRVWLDPVVQLCFKQEEQNLDAPLGYIMKEMDRICQSGYQPTNDDVLNCRKRTTGATFLKFEAYDTRFLLIDVGGQKAERKRWILNFDNADVVIFVVGMDQYDQVDLQDGENKLKDAIELFRDMCKSPWLCTSSFLLFLNKSDIFKTKIKQIPFTSSPYLKKEYKGDPHDYEQCTKFIIKKFQQIHAEWYQIEKERRKSIVNNANNASSSSMKARRASSPTMLGFSRSSRSSRSNSQLRQQKDDQIPQMYWYVTCATDTESMKFIIHMCRDIFLKKEMAKFGFTDV